MIIVTLAAEALTSSASTRHEQGKGNGVGKKKGPWGPSSSLVVG